MAPCQNTSANPADLGAGDHRAPFGEQVACDPPSCIAPPRMDGHTRARFAFDPAALSDASPHVASREFGQLVRELRRPRSKLDERREKRAGLNVVQMPTGEHAEVTVSGTRRQMLSFHIWGHAFITVNVDEGDVRLQWKAHALWSQGDEQRPALAHWISVVHRWVTGEPIELEHAHAAGWTMTGLEICADFLGIRWRREDVEGFIGRYSRQTHDEVKTKTGDALTVFTGCEGDVHTINIGSRKSNLSWCLYDKTGQIERAKDGANLPTYVSTWRLYGYVDPTLACDAEHRVALVEHEVARAELRLTARGLSFELADGTPLNLRDPNECSELNIRMAWSHATHKCRLVDRATSTRAERCGWDDRWVLVHEAAALSLIGDAKQSREVMEDAHAEKVRRSSRQAATALRRLAALHGVAVGSPDALGLLARLADHYASTDLDLETYCAAYFQAVSEVISAYKFAEARELFLLTVSGDCTGLVERLDD